MKVLRINIEILVILESGGRINAAKLVMLEAQRSGHAEVSSNCLAGNALCRTLNTTEFA